MYGGLASIPIMFTVDWKFSAVGPGFEVLGTRFGIQVRCLGLVLGLGLYHLGLATLSLSRERERERERDREGERDREPKQVMCPYLPAGHAFWLVWQSCVARCVRRNARALIFKAQTQIKNLKAINLTKIPEP